MKNTANQPSHDLSASSNLTHPLMPVSLEEYKDALRNLALKNDPFIFDNKGADHAAAVMSLFFEYCTEVRIYANDMNGDISNKQDYQQALKNFLEKDNSSLKIMFDGEPSEGSQSVQYLKNFSDGRKVQFKTATDTFRSAMKEIAIDRTTLYHFAVGDERMVRLESDNKNHIAPFCSFNHPVSAEMLIKLFDHHFTESPDHAL